MTEMLTYTTFRDTTDLMVISPATEKTSRTYSLNSFTLIAFPSNLIFLLSNFSIVTRLTFKYFND